MQTTKSGISETVVLWTQSRNGVIGISGRLMPWNAIEPKLFAKVMSVQNGTAIMGLDKSCLIPKKFALDRPLKKIIVSQDLESVNQIKICKTCDEAITFCNEQRSSDKYIFVVGESQVYYSAINNWRTDHLIVFEAQLDIPDSGANILAPKINKDVWQTTSLKR